jgi:MerR family Zn(II)-responsive transcriptional regulator of zntA
MNSYPQTTTVMLINELAKRAGVTTHTIRFYERYGLLKGHRDPAVTSNNYFHYDEEALSRLLLIIEAKSVGFTLQEISEIIDAWYGDMYSKREKRLILERKMDVLDQKIKELKNMKTIIRECIDDL